MSKLTDKEWGEICFVINSTGRRLCEYSEWSVCSLIYNKTLTWKKVFSDIPTRTFLCGDMDKVQRGVSGCGLTERTLYRAKARLMEKGLINISKGKYALNISAFLKFHLDLLEQNGQHDSKYHKELRAIYDKAMKMKGFRMPTMKELEGTHKVKTGKRQEKQAKVKKTKDGSRDSAMAAWKFAKDLCDKMDYITHVDLSWDNPEDVKILGLFRGLTKDPNWRAFLTRCFAELHLVRAFIKAYRGVYSHIGYVYPETFCKYKADIEKYWALESGKEYDHLPAASKKYLENPINAAEHSERWAKYADN
jgi:hypothetical protein